MQIKSQPSYDVNNYNIKSGTASNKSQEKAATFANMLDNYSSEEVTTKVTYENMTEAERIKTFKGIFPVNTKAEASANLEKLKQKNAKGEAITEEDVVKCMTCEQYMSFEGDIKFSDGIIYTDSEIERKRREARIASGRNYMSNPSTMEFLFQKATKNYKDSAGQPENIVQFAKDLMNLSGELYKILKENKAAQLANVSQ